MRNRLHIFKVKALNIHIQAVFTSAAQYHQSIIILVSDHAYCPYQIRLPGIQIRQSKQLYGRILHIPHTCRHRCPAQPVGQYALTVDKLQTHRYIIFAVNIGHIDADQTSRKYTVDERNCLAITCQIVVWFSAGLFFKPHKRGYNADSRAIDIKNAKERQKILLVLQIGIKSYVVITFRLFLPINQLKILRDRRHGIDQRHMLLLYANRSKILSAHRFVRSYFI